uniref:Uncharacterized protein n=1 Tax=Ascaris lumbricoides TaxID=6252 RepID=A0A9J2PXA4_ASCLU
MVKEVQECLKEMRYHLDNFTDYRLKCVKIFQEHYNGLRDARTVSTLLSSSVFSVYDATIKKLIQTLRRVKYETQPKIFDWRNFDINLRQFEALYREGGKDNHEIHDLLKMRKILQSDVIPQIEQLSLRLNSALTARNNFFDSTELQPIENISVSRIQHCIECLQALLSSTETLKVKQFKKSNFLRAEWLSRLQRQVTIAKSYSPSPQYDEINLLFVKIYFAHFKQEVILQERSYNLFLLLAEIGGTIGLYVGATLLTVAETIVFFIEKRTRKFFIRPSEI